MADEEQIEGELIELPPADSNVKRILVIDDITYVVKSITKILRSQGYFVISAMTGKEAIEKFGKYKPHLITVDQKLPDMSGIQLVEQIRCLDGGYNTKIIFISAVQEKEEIKSILTIGIDNYILKPFKKEMLIKIVSDLLSQQ
ncbi:MAG: response regulator [Spirochaetales bacterium]|nr:response regulator [Spirochaetales bacterium]